MRQLGYLVLTPLLFPPMLLRCRLGNKRAPDGNKWVSAASALLLETFAKRYLVIVNMEWALDTIHLKRYGNIGMNSLDGAKLRRQTVSRYASTGIRFSNLDLWTNDLRTVGICVNFGLNPFSGSGSVQFTRSSSPSRADLTFDAVNLKDLVLSHNGAVSKHTNCSFSEESMKFLA